MVSTSREQEVFLLLPERKEPNHPRGEGEEDRFILVVEDDAPTLRLQRVILEEAGYRVEVVDCGEAALDFLTGKSPSLVLLDIGLPGIDGFTTCARIRETSQVPIIMVTGRDCLDDKVKGMDGGADDYVTKPFLSHELATRVKALIRRSNIVSNDPLQPEASSLPVPANYDPPQPEASSLPVPANYDPPRVDPVKLETNASTGANTALPPATSELPGAPSQNQESANPTTVAEGLNPMTPRGSYASGSYEGTVRLAITTLGPVRNLINFVSELRQSPKFRLLRLVANQRTEGMDIWLGLRGPMPLVELLTAIHGVHSVVPGDVPDKETADQLLLVTLD